MNIRTNKSMIVSAVPRASNQESLIVISLRIEENFDSSLLFLFWISGFQ